MRVQGGQPIKLTKSGGISGVESFDGRFLYYSKYEAGGVWRMPLGGGDETQVLEEVRGGSWPNWGLTADGIYLLRFDKSPHATIQFFDFVTQKIIPIWTLEKEPGWGMTMSRDGKLLAAGNSKGAFLWNAETGEKLRPLEGNSIHRGAFHPDGK